MHFTVARLGVLLAALVTSLQVAAEPRFWTLSGVQVGGTQVAGYFSYDDVTQTVSNWNVYVDGRGFPGLLFPSFTFLPGNSDALGEDSLRRGGVLSIILTSEFTASHSVGQRGVLPLDFARTLYLTTRAPLDGSNSTVSVDLDFAFSVYGIGLPFTKATAGSLTLMPVPPAVVIVQVDEFHNAALGHYFITANSDEKQSLDSVNSGWTRTGESFKAYAKGSSSNSASVNPVCRFYSPALRLVNDVEYFEGSNAHFFTADAGECMTVTDLWWYAWLMEDNNAFQIDVPDKTSGTCPPATIPVHRLTNHLTDSSHRYTTSAAIHSQMLAAGYLAEGVVMCAVQ